LFKRQPPLIMGAVLGCCETDATQMGMNVFKQQLEGQTKKVQPDPRIDPEVYVTFVEVLAKDGAEIKFSPLKFTLRDITFKTSCRIVGNKSQLFAAGAAKGAAALTGKVAGQETKDKVVSGVVNSANKALGATAALAGKMGLSTETSERTILVDVTVDLLKEFNADAVVVTVKDINTKFEGGSAQDYATAIGEKILSRDSIRKFMENAISAKASEIATRMAVKKQGQALEKVGLSSLPSTG